MTISSFVIASLAILLTPGPTNTLLAASGAARGLSSSLALPVAEAAGYAVAITCFLSAAEGLRGLPLAMPLLKAAAAAWLLYSAAGLWTRPVVPRLADSAKQAGFGRVVLTTMLNPKAMLVGTIIIPNLMPDAAAAAIGSFVLMSMLAGTAWVALGASLPAAARRHSYKAAAVVLTGFAVAAASSAVQL